MNINPLSGTNSTSLQSLLTSTLNKKPSTASTTAASTVNTQDTNQLSPFAQLLNTLQQLQQSDPSKYQQVTQQIATNLQAAAKTETADGNTTAATQLNQLATDFTNASQSGQLPNVQDLSQAVSGGHHHGHHAHTDHIVAGIFSLDGSSSSSSSASTTGSTTNSSDLVSQFLNNSGSGTSQSSPLNPMSIIMNSLSTAGVKINS